MFFFCKIWHALFSCYFRYEICLFALLQTRCFWTHRSPQLGSLMLSVVKRNNSLEIWAVKLWFLFIYENVLKSIATAHSECTAKYENKASYNTDYIVPDLIDFFGDDWKKIKTQIEKRNIHNCKKYCND